MKKRILFILLAVVLAISVGLMGCGGEQEEEEEEEEEIEGTVLIGGSFPLTGPYPEDGGRLVALVQADFFADAELIPCYRGDCSDAPTGVTQDSWGRIKASFRQAEENEP